MKRVFMVLPLFMFAQLILADNFVLAQPGVS